jgi:hypothetical protein
MKNYHSLPDD